LPWHELTARCVDAAVGVALELFIEKGYEGATFGEPTEAMGIKPPSFYAAFGSKEGLFLRAVEAYAGKVDAAMAESLAQPTAYAALEVFLHGAADAYTDPARPPGCLYVQGASPPEAARSRFRSSWPAGGRPAKRVYVSGWPALTKRRHDRGRRCGAGLAVRLGGHQRHGCLSR
jgi:AcrR family transcriptional regulator